MDQPNSGLPESAAGTPPPNATSPPVYTPTNVTAAASSPAEQAPEAAETQFHSEVVAAAQPPMESQPEPMDVEPTPEAAGIPLEAAREAPPPVQDKEFIHPASETPTKAVERAPTPPPQQAEAPEEAAPQQLPPPQEEKVLSTPMETTPVAGSPDPPVAPVAHVEKAAPPHPGLPAPPSAPSHSHAPPVRRGPPGPPPLGGGQRPDYQQSFGMNTAPPPGRGGPPVGLPNQGPHGAPPFPLRGPPVASGSGGPPPPPPGPPHRSLSQEERRLPPGPSPPPPHASAPPVHPSTVPHPAARPPPPTKRFFPAAAAPAQPPVAAPPPPMPSGGMRELRVEDALLYLDDVKREFGDRPKIYNEFLEIMKNFKSQEVDTPGVIKRVSKLFRGYNNLILGFNKFLPDGYKITIEDIDRSNEEHRRQQEAAAAAAGQAPPHIGGGSQSGYYSQPASGAAQAAHMSSSPQSHMQGRGPPAAAMPVGGARQGASGQPQFAKPPNAQGAQHSGNMGRPLAKKAAASGSPSGNLTQQHAAGSPANAPQQQGQTRGSPQQQPPQQHQAVEFDHAISYVTNIKKRFANDPSTYHSFLEILHTYQKEQRGIKEVLEQVAALFSEHPDLLKEFTFFLPDAVQEQAKERLHRAAADSEARQAAAMEQRAAQYGHGGEYRGRHGQHLPSGGQKIYDMTGAEQARDSSPTARIQQPRKRPFSPSSMAPLQPPQPEAYVYNSAVERQFFDAVKEALTSYSRDGGQAWAEFLKCLDMYAQEILSRSQMLDFVEPLLGKRNLELFEEFKRILAAAGSQSGPVPSMEDSWYSVPLSDIDFTRCRRCSPSYRALPRDYPPPPCSWRSEDEAKILNDVWVSLPVGSEESYTFRHMRRNTYEETLFRCEDERFEIDMVIDSNAATLRRLEPIAEEIAQLAQEELVTQELVSGSSGAKTAGMAGKKYQYVFDDKQVLGVIHRNSIARLYGDSGQEMLDLVVKNPTVAIPVLVQRLRQMDRKWKAARERLNRHWKELAEINYYKSLDNRALTWRTVDKRATSTRTLVSEIKDRAANEGRESEAAVMARLEKSKEEKGTFYEVTMRDHLTTHLDLTHLPKPDEKLFTPHLSLMYENNSWAQRDAYRIIAFALERGATSPADKENCHRLWREFLGPFFDLSLNWMQRPSLDYKRASASNDDSHLVVSNGEIEPIREEAFEDEESSSADEAEVRKNDMVMDDLEDHGGVKAGDEIDAPTIMDHHTLPAGTRVSTIYGEATIVQHRRADMLYVVALPFGATAYVQPSAVLCSVRSVETSGFTNQLRSDDKTSLERTDDVMAIGTQSLYLFFRLHQILNRRLGIAKDVAYKVCTDKTLSTLVEQMKGDPGQDMGKKRYDAFLSLVYSLIAGGHNSMGSSAGAAEGGKYEDRVRCLLGHGAYELATMDKLISHIVKNIQNMASDETMQNLVQIFRRHLDAGSFKPDAFRQEAAYLSDGENMFAFQYSKVPNSDKSVLHTEFLGVIAEEEEEEEDEDSLEHGGMSESAPTTASGTQTTDEAVAVEQDEGAPPTKRQRRGNA